MSHKPHRRRRDIRDLELDHRLHRHAVSTVSYVGVGTCSVTAHVAPGTATRPLGQRADLQHRTGRAVDPAITNIPADAVEFGSFTAIVGTTGDGTTSVTSNTPAICTVGPDGLTVTFVSLGTCTSLPASDRAPTTSARRGARRPSRWTRRLAATGSSAPTAASSRSAQPPSTAPWAASPCSVPWSASRRPSTRDGYWLVASDGGIFSFGDSAFYGSIPGLGLHPAGSGLPNSLNAPIVGMVPTITGRGYFMVASDGGVFAFGDARFEGSCPGIGGCSGAAVAVMPDHSGNGYWLVTATGGVYAFGDAALLRFPAARRRARRRRRGHPGRARLLDAVRQRRRGRVRRRRRPGRARSATSTRTTPPPPSSRPRTAVGTGSPRPGATSSPTAMRPTWGHGGGRPERPIIAAFGF